MPTTCNIEFENSPSKLVYAGQLLRGTVQLNLTHQKNVCGVYIRIYGTAFVQWKEGRNELTGQEDYINEQMYFMGERNGEVHLLLPGKYNFKFQCQLPAELPSSCDGRYGHVRYNIRCVIDRPMWPDKKFKFPFTVIRTVNLNDFPSLREPVIVEKAEKIHPCYVLCCVSDPVKIIARTKAAGYCPGQIINIEIILNNQSNVPIIGITVELIKQIIYFKRGMSKTHKWESIPMIQQFAEGCDEGQEKIIAVNLDCPRTPPSDNLSNLLKVSYLIRIIASTPIFCSKFKLYMPIMIGSNPFQVDSSTQNMYLHPNAVSPENVILQQPSSVKLPEEESGPKITEWIDPPTYGDALHVNFNGQYPALKITPPALSSN